MSSEQIRWDIFVHPAHNMPGFFLVDDVDLHLRQEMLSRPMFKFFMDLSFDRIASLFRASYLICKARNLWFLLNTIFFKKLDMVMNGGTELSDLRSQSGILVTLSGSQPPIRSLKIRVGLLSG